MLSTVLSCATIGIDAYIVEVEVDIALGLPTFSTVGLPDAAVKESKDRVKAAISNTGFEFPVRRITVNLAPADIKKVGPIFDLPIAIGIIAAQGLIDERVLKDYIILGELSLDGSIRSIKGSLSMAVAARSAGKKGIILPKENCEEAAVVQGVNVYPVSSFPDAVEFLNGRLEIPSKKIDLEKTFENHSRYKIDFTDVKGQEHAKRALEVAASGGHNIIMIGSPGSGKTMLAKRLPTILPDMTFEEAIETTKIHSVTGLLEKNKAMIATRPFRSPHHTISDAGLIGGGAMPMPGEVSLSHNGVLFLDELPEFRRNVLEVMRQPLEDGKVTISRALASLTFPARFMLAAAMNPCPCGFKYDTKKECTCTSGQIQKYLAKISGPLLDRIDIHIDVPSLKYKELSSDSAGESSSVIRKRVNSARKVQHERFKGDGIFCNAHMSPKQIKKHCAIDEAGQRLLETAINKFALSARAYDRILKVSRTIADLEGVPDIRSEHISEAIQYRSLDRGIG
ncbi:MAG: hypothetical protein A2042_09695 [Candidatus Schekmanbacteria bacterium GWA2_38_11]|uniref:ATP-dependent protease n=1 Tax=Candidatus Schekmanbacteria bacterium GWA2_38_11 TaxID=1817876 RepID=A0A1F7RHL5_9BACT|nr:MAG: hypothetical protein A2042_09695 [Candidatus Schekmanbacteria bacterium GWA2_38_11]